MTRRSRFYSDDSEDSTNSDDTPSARLHGAYDLSDPDSPPDEFIRNAPPKGHRRHRRKKSVSKTIDVTIYERQIASLSELVDAYSALFTGVRDPSLRRSLAELKNQHSQILSNRTYLSHTTQLADFVVDLRNYKKIKNLQDGGFGYVYCARDKKTNVKYAIKVLKTSCSDPDDQRYFLREVGIFAEISHPAVLPFKGFALYDADHDRNPAIVTEYMARGSLDDVLESELAGNPPADWNNTKRMIVLLGTVAGMAHLHAHNVIHRDLKPGNILMNDHLEPFITDFGLSKIFKAGKSMSQSMFCGTPLWMAPELLTEDPFGPKVDVYAFAMIAYQVVTRSTPFGKVKQFQLQRKVISGERPNFPESVPDQFKRMISACWSQNPDERPSFDQLVSLFIEDNLHLPGTDAAEYRSYVRRLGLTSSVVATTQITLKDQADAGLTDAEYEYGLNLKEGRGCQKNTAQAVKYLKKAANKGHPNAMAELGDLFLNGEGVPEDLEMAVQYFKKSSDLGSGKGMNSYGCAFAHGWGVKKNKETAAHYFRLSAEKGYPWGLYNYGLRLKNGRGVPKDNKMAVKYLKEALAAGIEDAAGPLQQVDAESS